MMDTDDEFPGPDELVPEDYYESERQQARKRAAVLVLSFALAATALMGWAVWHN